MSGDKPSAAALRAAQEIVVRYQNAALHAMNDSATWVGVDASLLAAIIERNTYHAELVNSLRQTTDELQAVFAYGMAAVDPERFTGTMYTARAVLEKVTGEPKKIEYVTSPSEPGSAWDYLNEAMTAMKAAAAALDAALDHTITAVKEMEPK
jgi:hypothetical protein